MFCPRCGTLALPSPAGEISCLNYICGYNGPAEINIKTEQGNFNETSFINEVSSSELDYRVIRKEKKFPKFKGDAECPKCENSERFTIQRQELYGADDDIVNTILHCEDCGEKFNQPQK